MARPAAARKDGMRWGTAGMDETSLRTLLKSAMGDEPPIGLVGRNPLREGIQLRRRARMRRAAGAAAVVAAVAAALTAVTGILGDKAAAPSAGTAYVVIQGSGTVVPIDLATNSPTQPIQVGRSLYAIAITPDGKTAYVSDGENSLLAPDERNGAVTPVDLATDTPGTPIRFSVPPFAIAITPDGKTAYVVAGGNAVTPIDLATGAPGTPIHIAAPFMIAITPDGKTAYVASLTNTVTPIDLATNTPGTPIHVAGPADAIAITPDGKTAYVAGGNAVTPIDLATGAPGTPIHVAGPIYAIAITPDGKTAYVAGGNAVTPIHLATGTPGKPIRVWHHPSGYGQYIGSPGSIAIMP